MATRIIVVNRRDWLDGRFDRGLWLSVMRAGLEAEIEAAGGTDRVRLVVRCE